MVSDANQMIYMDHAATTPVSPEAVAAMEPYHSKVFGNPSSLYSIGQSARKALDEARERVAGVLGARPDEIIFTSGGSESNNTALLGSVLGLGVKDVDIITSAAEHHSILYSCRLLQRLGYSVTILPVDEFGTVKPGRVIPNLTHGVGIVSIMLANNEIGTIQPIREISDQIKALHRNPNAPIIVHTDAVQAPGFLSVDVNELGVDMLSLSAHKFRGPKGVGILYIRRNSPFFPVQMGGSQERDRRAGTENVAGIVGASVALEIAQRQRDVVGKYTKSLRDLLIEGILERIQGARLNGHPENRMPNNANFSIKGVDAEALLIGLDLAGIAASSGSACTAGSLDPSHVLLALGQDERSARSSLRLTLGADNTKEDVEYVIDTTSALVKRLRSLN